MSVPPRKPWTAGIWAKLNRAEHHLADLNERVGEYLDADPYTIRVKEYPQTNTYEFVLTVVAEPPLGLSVIIGDCLQNLRAVLDHLAWELVYANSLTPSIEHPRTQFPIYTSQTTKTGKPRIVDILPGIHARAQGVIESLQPYHRRYDPQAHPLAILQELSNADKHRTLHLTAAQVTEAEIYLVTPKGQRFGGDFDLGVLHDDDTIGVFQLPPGFRLPQDWDIEGVGASFVAFRELGPWSDQPVILVLDDLLEYVRNIVVGGLQPFIDKALDL